MAKLLIVDDDHFIRTGLEQLIDWSELGVEVAGLAKSGNEAYRIFLERQPEIVLTDIKMPDGNGLELIGNVREKNWGTRIVVLSGYDDYDYVRQAAKFQVEDYLLKPVDADELVEIMKSCVNDLASMRQSEQAKMESFQLLRDNLLSRWVENRIDEEQLKDKLGFFAIDLRAYGAYQAGVVLWTDLREPEIGENEKRFRPFAIHNYLEETMRSERKGLCFLQKDQTIVCLFLGLPGADGSFAHDNLTWLREKADVIASRFKTPFYAGLGPVSATVQTVHRSYSESVRVLYTLPLTGPPACADSGSRVPARDALPSLAERQAMSPLMSGDPGSWTAAFDEDFHWAALQDDPVSAAKYVAARWIILIRQTLLQLNSRLLDEFAEAELYGRLSGKQDLPEVKRALLVMLQQVAAAIDRYKQRKRNPLVDELVDYVHRHFDEEMSLQVLSHKVNANNIYLGRLFKEEIGMLFSDYLTQVRMEKAIELLSGSHLKASEIAGRVGFTDPNYFFRKFKQFTGLSPTEYRKLRQSGPSD